MNKKAIAVETLVKLLAIIFFIGVIAAIIFNILKKFIS